MLLELNDLCFFVKSLKNKSSNNSFNISEYVSFIYSHNHTRSGTFSKLYIVQPCIKYNREKQFYFNRLPYLWISLLPIDLSLSCNTIINQLKSINFSGSLFSKYSTLILVAPITVPVPAQGVSHSPNHASLNNFEIKPKSNSLILFTSTIIYT